MHGHDKTCAAVNLGRIGYADAWDLQQRLVASRKAGAAPDLLLLCEHPHVLTLGRNGRMQNVRVPQSALDGLGVEFHHSNRGGDVTYHGPGQVVGYPILQLGEIRRDVGWYVRQLEEVMMRTAAAFGVNAFRVPGRTGVWTRPGDGLTSTEEKLGAIGVHISRWVTSHGFAFNICTDLSYFDLIVPCGIADCRTTSLEKLLARPVSTAEVLPVLAEEFGRAFGLQMRFAGKERLGEWLSAADPHMQTGAAAAGASR
jgi:lipoyl(octanoyl) transferase